MRATPSRVRRTAQFSLREILPDARWLGTDDIHIGACASDAQHIRPGDLFVAVVDKDGDGHDAAEIAVNRGASALLVERMLPLDVPQCVVADTRVAFGRVCQALAGQPTDNLFTVGIAGAHGKTSVSLLVAAVLNHRRSGVGVATSLAFSDSRVSTPSTTDTVTPPQLADLLARTKVNGCKHAVVELTAETLAQRFATGVKLDIAVLTNLSDRDTDRFGSASNEREIQLRLLELVKAKGTLVLNADDPRTRRLLDRAERPLLTFGMSPSADVRAEIVERSPSEQMFYLSAGEEMVPVRTKIVGDAHVMNCLAAATVGLLHGVPLTKIARGLESVDAIPGRLDRVECGQEFSLYIDEARNPAALASALRTARQLASGRVWCLLSAPGELDRAGQAEMGTVAERLGHSLVLTSEGAATGDSLELAHRLLDGIKQPGKAQVIPDRTKAIAWVLERARPGDVVIVAGMGHRGYKESPRRKSLVDDFVLCRRWLYDTKNQTPKIIPFPNLDQRARGA